MSGAHNTALRPFAPLISNPHLLTIAAHFWPAGLDERRFPVESRVVCTEPGVQVLVRTQRPSKPAGDVILVHGLEASSESSYMKTAARALLEAGSTVHRLNLRSCGGTEALCPTLYHSGLTADLRCVLEQLAAANRRPSVLVGFSLGGNLSLKLAGELGDAAGSSMAGVCAVSPPLDLAVCVARLEQRENLVYQRRFLRKLKRRMRAKARLFPGRYKLDGLDRVGTVREFDERFTAPAFGFRDAAHYYATQSASGFLHRIRVPALLIQAKDDPLIPFALFEQAAVRGNPQIRLLAAEHGGHLGFLSRGKPRFWADAAIVEWISSLER